MEFLPIEKYSSDRKTGKHKRDIAKRQKREVANELKAGCKVKIRKTASPVTKVAADAKKQKVKRIQTLKVVEQKGKAVTRKGDPAEEPTKAEKVVPASVVKQGKTIPSTLTKRVLSNRLFVNMKRKILNPQEVKDLHLDIVSVTLPRKKRSSWCWAVFESKEKAVKALKVLKKRDDIIVNHELSEESKKEKREKKMKKVKLKKEIKKTLRDTWM